MRKASTALEATQIAKSAERVSTSPLCLLSTSSTTGSRVSATCSGAISNSASMIESERVAADQDADERGGEDQEGKERQQAREGDVARHRRAVVAVEAVEGHPEARGSAA